MRPRKPAAAVRSETDIQREILDFLRECGVFAWRNNTVGVYDQRKKCYRKNPMQMKGAADIIGIIPYITDQGSTLGRMLAIEVKSPGGQVSDEQRIFLTRIIDNGGIAFVARSVKQAAEQLLTHFRHNARMKQFAEHYVSQTEMVL